MKRGTNAYLKSKELLATCGLDEITDLPMDLLVSGLDAILIEEELGNCDGKIIFKVWYFESLSVALQSAL